MGFFQVASTFEQRERGNPIKYVQLSRLAENLGVRMNSDRVGREQTVSTSHG